MVGLLGIFKSSIKINITILELKSSRTSADTYNMRQISNFTYFKVTFIIITAGVTGGLITNGLFDVGFGHIAAIGNLIFKSLMIGAIIGALMGFLNIFFKIGHFPKQSGKSVWKS